jgi:hypothetical protein
MAKIVVRTKGRVHVIEQETMQERSDRLWLEKYQLMVEFANQYGPKVFPSMTNYPQYDPKYKILKGWIRWQRKYNTMGTLEEWRFDLLSKIGFDFNPFETRWNEKYQELIEFKEIYGHCNVPTNTKVYKKLGVWVQTQRQYRETLSKEKQVKLEEIEFDWGFKAKDWLYMYSLLKEYYYLRGYSNVKWEPNNPEWVDKIKPIYKWLELQIVKYHNGDLSKEKIYLLKDIKFDFDHQKNKLKKTWDLNIDKLIKYKERYGDYNVPNHWEEDRSFAKWVLTQREKRATISEEKRASLEGIGFNWLVLDDIWEQRLIELKNYIKEHGHSKVSELENKRLYLWMSHQRVAKRENTKLKLSKDKIAKLEEIGFMWEPCKKYWSRCFRLLVEFKNQNGHCNVVLNNDTEILYKWCESNRKNKPNLTTNQIQKLNKIGFVWDAMVALEKRLLIEKEQGGKIKPLPPIRWRQEKPKSK